MTSIVEELPGIIAVATFGLGATLMVTGFGYVGLVVFVVGWFLLTPLAGILEDTDEGRALVDRLSGSTDAEETDEATEAETALEELKRRYARGELSDEEFERRTERLLDNETVSDVRRRIERGDAAVDADRDVEIEDDIDAPREREYDLERE